MNIREETTADHAEIRKLVMAAFGQETEADLVEALRADGDSVIALVAEEDGHLIGHVVFSPMDAPFRALGLAPIAVLPERMGHGVGSALITAGIEHARREGWQGIFVLGEPDYYRRFGFDPGAAGGFDCVYAGPYLMALPLADELPTRGKISYAPAFAHMEP